MPEDVVVIALSFLVLFIAVAVYALADLAVQLQACKKPCRCCPHWERCLSRRISTVKPYQNPELCVLRWS